MLVLKCRRKDAIIINATIDVKVVGNDGTHVYLRISMPPGTVVDYGDCAVAGRRSHTRVTLRCREGQSFRMNDAIEVTMQQNRWKSVYLGIEAPRIIPIERRPHYAHR